MRRNDHATCGSGIGNKKYARKQKAIKAAARSAKFRLQHTVQLVHWTDSCWARSRQFPAETSAVLHKWFNIILWHLKNAFLPKYNQDDLKSNELLHFNAKVNKNYLAKKDSSLPCIYFNLSHIIYIKLIVKFLILQIKVSRAVSNKLK